MDFQIGIPHSRIFQIAAIHFVLMVNAMFTLRTIAAYEFYNILFFISLFWSIKEKEATEPVNVAYAINFASIFFDIAVCFAIDTNNWALAFILLNMIFRVFSLKQIYEEMIARGGEPANIGIV
ncbi:unnamed protein product [Chironomus riparius]|uniref:Uncharacterized protein n=1 Tax=Chironomus riparius TaxID=315576 RepID=A0A9N9RSW4_9DIPT|nr:unnamed protein product [Chironomus riparius]